MSRIGLKCIAVDSSVCCEIDKNGELLIAKFPDGSEFRHSLPHGIFCVLENDNLRFHVSDVSGKSSRKAKDMRSLLGLHRSLVSNAISGAVKKFKIVLSLSGVGYKAEIKDRFLNIFVGYTHSIKYLIPNEITIHSVKGVELILESSNKQLLGSVCSDLCKLRKYDPYKGKGVMVKGAQMLRKESNKK